MGARTWLQKRIEEPKIDSIAILCNSGHDLYEPKQVESQQYSLRQQSM